MAGDNGDDWSGIPERDARLARAITLGISGALAPEFAQLRQAIGEQTAVLNQHTRILLDQTRVLNEHTGILHEHTGILNEHTVALVDIRANVAQLQSGAVGVGRFTALEERVAALERKVK